MKNFDRGFSMFNSKTRTNLIASLLGLAVIGLSPAAFAESGAFLGASVGTATVSADVPDPIDPGFADINFDEDDFAWKVYGGYAWDLPILDLGVELGYFDLGSPSVDFAGDEFGIGVSGYSAFVLAGVNLGPVGLFIKGGMASWDADLLLAGLRGSESGSDPAYGVGLRLTFGSLEVRGEYEVFDIENADDVYMASLGLAWRF
jgi:outer membrane immunogenic protein